MSLYFFTAFLGSRGRLHAGSVSALYACRAGTVHCPRKWEWRRLNGVRLRSRESLKLIEGFRKLEMRVSVLERGQARLEGLIECLRDAIAR